VPTLKHEEDAMRSKSTVGARAGVLTTAFGIVAAATLFSGTAQAATVVTDHGTYTESDVFQDPDVCASYGFVVNVVFHDKVTWNVRAAGTAPGDPATWFLHHDIDVETTANGKTIHETDHFNETYYPGATSSKSAGVFRIMGVGGHVLLLDAGLVRFDASGQPTFVAGPHPQLEGAGWCEALLP
jgi:hypothetical protein